MIKINCERFKNTDLKTLIDNWADERLDLIIADPTESEAIRLACWEYVVQKDEEISAFYSFIREYEVFYEDNVAIQVEDYDIYKGWAYKLCVYKCPLNNKYYGICITDGRYEDYCEDEFHEVEPHIVNETKWVNKEDT